MIKSGTELNSNYKESGSENISLKLLCGSPMETGRFLIIAIHCAEALEKIHAKNVFHGNIHPDTIRINPDTGDIIISKPVSLSRTSVMNEHSLTYISPEQTGRMNCPVDTRTDMYSLGIVFYELLTGKPPFIANDPLELVYFHLARTAVPPVLKTQMVPEIVSEIVIKLIAKSPDERYQTAIGLKSDLQECYDQLSSSGNIKNFDLGQFDIPDHLIIPQKLYGREVELFQLLKSFERMIENGRPEYITVTGYSGIGKTSLVRELHKPVVRERGLFISGKFDQYKRNIPYSTIAEAFRGLIQQILSENKKQIETWKKDLVNALGINAQLIVEIIPEIELIIGKQPAVRELPPREAQNRFNKVFMQFISVFTTRNHPLVVFLDDLQWSDDASLTLFELLATHPDIRYLLFIGAYRDNEVDPFHPLIKTINNITEKGRTVAEINLLPLSASNISDLISDVFQTDKERVKDLSMLICEKTAGIPFFVIRFFILLYDEGLLVFNNNKRIWSWDIGQIQAKEYTDNVVDMMVKQLLKFSDETREILKMSACIGNRFEIEILAGITGNSIHEISVILEEAVKKGLILNHGDRLFSFLHDRVQQAAYSLIPEESRNAAHLQIGRLLLSQTPSGMIEEKVFDIVNQMNHGAALIADPEEKYKLAELNLKAGMKARSSTAYSSAIDYLSVGTSMLPEDYWNSCYELSYELFLNLAESTFMKGKLDEAEQLLTDIISKAQNKIHLARASYIKVYLYHVKGVSSKGTETGIECLKRLDFELSINPTREQAEAEYNRVWQNLGDREIEDLINLPAMTDPDMLIASKILGVIYVPAVYTNVNLAIMLLSTIVNVSILYGNCDISPVGYVAFGEVIGPELNDYSRGYRFGQLGYDIVEKTEAHPFRGQADFQYAQFINPYLNHISTSIEILERGFNLTVAAGDLPFACYCCQSIITDHLVNGTRLEDVFIESEKRLAFVREGKFKISELVIFSQQLFIKNLQGLTDNFSTFNSPGFNQDEFEVYLENNREPLAIGVVRYYIRKLQARYFSGDYAEGIELIKKISPLLWTMPSFMEVPEYYYYASLILSSYYHISTPEDQTEFMKTLIAYSEQMRKWSDSCPVNFLCKSALIDAEIASIKGNDIEAMKLYEKAIHSAGESKFVHNQAISYEAAGRFYLSRGYSLFAQVYLNESRDCYKRWGAFGKIKQMSSAYDLSENRYGKSDNSDMVGHLDAISVVKASQAISGEIVLDNLLETLMKTMLENAGAQKGSLILLHNDELFLEIEAAIEGDTIKVNRPNISDFSELIPETLINYVKRSRNSVILEDARDFNMFSNDKYIIENRPVSVLSLPILRKTSLAGLLYLENNLIRGAFTKDRIAVLELLASQAAISLENANMYREHISMEEELKELNQRLEDIIDFLPDATFVINKEKRIIAWNKAMEELTGYKKHEIMNNDFNDYSLVFYNTSRPILADLVIDQVSNHTAYYDFFNKNGSIVSGEVFAPKVNNGIGAYLAGVASPLHDRRGAVVGVIESMRDITERKKSEDANNRLQALLRNTIDSMPSIIAGVDANGIINQWNIEARRFSGRSREDVIGHAIVDVLPIMKRCSSALNKALVNGEIPGVEKVSVYVDGKTQYLNINIYPLIRKEIEGAVIRIDDVTESRLKEEQLFQAQKMETVGTLAGGLAHDFNNVLSGIMGTVSLMKFRMEKEDTDKKQIMNWIEIIDRSSSRAAAMVNQLLVLSRKHEVNLIPMDLNTAVKNVMQICANSFDKSIELTTEYSNEKAMAEGVPEQIEQVILNLCVNASHAMTLMRKKGEKQGGKLTITIKKLTIDTLFCTLHPEARPGNFWLISHSDTGVGIDNSLLNKIYDPFFTTKEKGSGTGLGLSMVYNIIHQHKGFIDVYSEVGTGSTFNIYLPVYEYIDSTKPLSNENQICRGSGLVLVIDDEDVVRLIASNILTECGYDVIEAENGQQGIKIFKEMHERIVSVLLDMAMPGMSGDEVFIELRKIQPDVKVLLSSGFRQDMRVEKVLSLGVGGFIQKPYSVIEMSRKMKDLLDKKNGIC